MSASLLPRELLLHILRHLSDPADLCRASQVCWLWWRLCQDDVLWRRVTLSRYNIPVMRASRPVRKSWILEYKRLTDEVPSELSQTVTAHTDEVLHVSFSHSGHELITCSKDGSFIVWEVEGDDSLSLKQREDMTQHGWIYTWSARYNSSDTLVLVAGVIDEVDGKIAVFQRSGGLLTLISHTDNSPYDVMGTWCGETSWLCGDMGSLGLDTNINLCQAQDGTMEPHTNLALKFKQTDLYESRNYLRCLHVSPVVRGVAARQRPDQEQLAQEPHPALADSLQSELCLIFLCSELTSSPHQLGFKIISRDNLSSVPVISQPDKVIDMLGHIVGISLQSGLLHVNVRRWPEGARPHYDYPPPIAREIETRVVDLATLKLSDIQYTGHKGYTDTSQAFYIYLDTSSQLVCSGSEDGLGYVWDKQYGCRLATLSHQDVVNCATINPNSQEMIVTVSDDQTIKVWISKQRQRRNKRSTFSHVCD